MDSKNQTQKREIKFRAFENEKMHYFDLSDTIAPNTEMKVMQYTGLKYKNGKEIYEGDIITCEIYEREHYNEYESEVPIKVYYGNGGFYPFTKAGQWRSSIENIEVIGNIHENPELI